MTLYRIIYADGRRGHLLSWDVAIGVLRELNGAPWIANPPVRVEAAS